MTRTIGIRVAAVVATASLLAACDGRRDPVAVESRSLRSAVHADAGGGSADDGQRLARALARALGDASVRVQLRKALRSSPWNEHKLVLGEYAASPEGGRLVAAAAAAAGVDPASVRRWIAAVGPMDLYVPLQPQRQNWAGSDNIVVGLNTSNDDPTLTGYTPDGSVVHLDARAGVPSRVVILLAPAEPKERRADAAGGARGTTAQPGMVASMDINGDSCGLYAVIECPVEGGANGPTQLLRYFVPLVTDGWGDPELTIIHWSTNPNTGGLINEVWRHNFGGSQVGVANNVNQPITVASTTKVEVKERDGWWTFDDDSWGIAYLSPSGTETHVLGYCGNVYADGFGQLFCSDYFDAVHTVDILYSY